MPRLRLQLSCLIPVLVFALCGCGRFALWSEGGPSKNPCVVLALPQTGAYSATAGKIRKGADEAKKQFLADGINVRIENIDTEQPDWLGKLEALPEMCAVVGGPLQEKAYTAARRSGELEKKVFFSFLPSLQKGDEGNVAWRFFPSPQDQIDALVSFATDDMNIHAYGVFYPDDNYGRRMADLLEKALAKRHISLQKASYNPAAPATWAASMRPLIRPTTSAGSKTPIPQTTFEALFLPDSWKHMDLLTNSLMYNGEDRLVLLGPMLWEQSLSGKKIAKSDKYALAVFPGAWYRERAPKALQAPANDFWVALGYDFVTFAVNTGLARRLEASAVTQRAQQAAPKARALAPFSWSGEGIASQRLYMFQVGPNGLKPLNPELFRQTRTAVKEQAALRMQGLANESAAPLEPEPGIEAVSADTPDVTPQASNPDTSPQPRVMPAATNVPDAARTVTTTPAGETTIMSTVPQPSYKLRLPAKR